jgi:hypothetical protein
VLVHTFRRGTTIATLAACADRIHVTATRDPDDRFVVVELPTPRGVLRAPFLALDGGVYSTMTRPMGGRATGAELTRGELEAEVAALADHSAATDRDLVDAIAQLDRAQAVWFVGSAAGTRLDAHVGRVLGTLGVERGVTLDVTIYLRGAGDGAELLAKVAQARAKVDELPAAMAVAKDAVRAISVREVPGGVRVTMALSEAQVDQLVMLAGPALGVAR